MKEILMNEEEQKGSQTCYSAAYISGNHVSGNRVSVGPAPRNSISVCSAIALSQWL